MFHRQDGERYLAFAGQLVYMTIGVKHFNQWTPSTSFPITAIAADIIRDIMAPYQLGTDLLAAVPPPPPEDTPAWRQQRTAMQPASP